MSETFKTLVGLEEENSDDFYLMAKNLSKTETAESLCDPIPIELRDNDDNNVAKLLAQILPEEVFLVQSDEIKLKRFFWESSPFVNPSFPTDFKEVLTFQSFTGLSLSLFFFLSHV